MAVLSVPTTEVEVLYPFQPSAKSNKLVFRKDSMEWNKVKKSKLDWRHEYITLRYRIKADEFEAFYEFHVDNKGDLVLLNIPGVQPFIRASESNEVWIITFSAPQRTLPKHFEMSVTYLNDDTTATT